MSSGECQLCTTVGAALAIGAGRLGCAVGCVSAALKASHVSFPLQPVSYSASRAGRPQTLDGDEPAAAQPLPVGKLDILVDMDVAALAGLLPDVSVPDPPSWYSDVLGEDLREIQVLLLPLSL